MKWLSGPGAEWFPSTSGSYHYLGESRAVGDAMRMVAEIEGDPHTSNFNAFTEAIAADSDKALELLIRSF
jgi:hypothetical protein